MTRAPNCAWVGVAVGRKFLNSCSPAGSAVLHVKVLWQIRHWCLLDTNLLDKLFLRPASVSLLVIESFLSCTYTGWD